MLLNCLTNPEPSIYVAILFPKITSSRWRHQNYGIRYIWSTDFLFGASKVVQCTWMLRQTHELYKTPGRTVLVLPKDHFCLMNTVIRTFGESRHLVFAFFDMLIVFEWFGNQNICSVIVLRFQMVKQCLFGFRLYLVYNYMYKARNIYCCTLCMLLHRHLANWLTLIQNQSKELENL